MVDLNKLYLGIEFGSTQVKAVLIDDKFSLIATGVSKWENKLVNGFYTYDYLEIRKNLSSCYKDLKSNFENKYGLKLTSFNSIGISAMMHGFIPLDKNYKPLCPFRTWRNNNASKYAEELSKKFNYMIPARYSIAHLYYSYKEKEPFYKNIRYIVTLSSYITLLLTGKLAVGVGDASGMFPLDIETKDYDSEKIKIFNSLIDNTLNIKETLPKIYYPNEVVNVLTKEGSLLLDESGILQEGIKVVPPEGDSSTGMVSTNTIKVNKCNISAGTSIFSMTVMDKLPSDIKKNMDIVFTPSFKPVSMVHCNNCTSDLNSYVSLFKQLPLDKNIDIYKTLFNESLNGENDCASILVYPYTSNENIENITKGMPALIKEEGCNFTLANFMRACIYSCFYSLTKAFNELVKEDIIQVDDIVAHGGIFKTENVAALYLSSALGKKVITYETDSLSGPYGMALLASYIDYSALSLEDFLDNLVFKNIKKRVYTPDINISNGYKTYSDKLTMHLKQLYNIKEISFSNEIDKLKEKVLEANLQLVKNNLVLFTWGNVSAISEDRKYVVIKPSGVEYSKMTKEDMVVVSINGDIIEGKLKPSSDLKTHLELYKAHKEIKGIVHTHSTYATSFAQAGRDIIAYGTTQADYFYGDIPCCRKLTAQEIETDYEKYSGVVINEKFEGKDIMKVRGCLLQNHGVFSWGNSAADAIYNATVIEEVAKMAYLTEGLNPNVKRIDQYILDKHYNRKHGKNAYYGQKNNKE